MAHEALKKQYEKDCRNYEQPWDLWQFQDPKKPKCMGDVWDQCVFEPAWNKTYKYRRIEPVFEPEYFSGLNWRDSCPLKDKFVEVSINGDDWHGPFRLTEIRVFVNDPDRFKCGNQYYPFIRTLPETHQHPTITVGGVKLPRPEVEAPEEGDIYYHVDSRNIVWQKIWENNTIDNGYLNARRVHLTESRAQAWASWWDETVVREINRD